MLQSLGLSGSGAYLRMQGNGNLVYRDANRRTKWSFNNALDAPTSGCPNSTSCFLEFALPSACKGYAGKNCTGEKKCPQPPPSAPSSPSPSGIYFVTRHINWGNVSGEIFYSEAEASARFDEYKDGPYATGMWDAQLNQLNYYGGGGARLGLG